MAINQAVDRSVLERCRCAASARVAAQRARARHRAMACRALAIAAGPEAARDLADAVHLLCSLYGRHPGLVELALGHCRAGRGARLAARRVGRVRARAALSRPPDRRGRAPALDPGLGRDRKRAWSPSATRSRRWPCPSAAAARLARRPRWSPTGPRCARVLDRAAARMGVDVPACTLPDQRRRSPR